MLRVLTLSTLFPDETRPTFGIFVERQTLGLAAHPQVELKVVAPVAVPPTRWAKRHPAYRAISGLPVRETWKGLDVLRPQFPTLPLIGGRMNPWAMARTLRPLLDEIRVDFPFDVIDAEFFYPDGPAAIRLGEHLGVPVSIKARGADIQMWGRMPLCRGMIREAGRKAAGMLAVSAALRNEMIVLGMPGEKIRVHHTGVDQSKFSPRDRKAAKAALGVEGPLVVTIGYLIPRKGQSLLIEAMMALPGVALLIAGDGPDRPMLDGRIAALGLGDRVKLIGPQPHDVLPGLLAAADAMALPSSSEGLANVWVEALACGTPIVITDVGGARELVDRPAAGRLVERTPDAIAEGVRSVLADPRPQSEVAEASRRFTWERNSETLYQHLKGLAGG